jgi:hypothetical protein
MSHSRAPATFHPEVPGGTLSPYHPDRYTLRGHERDIIELLEIERHQ